MNAKTQPIVNPQTQRVLKNTNLESLKKFYNVVAKSSNGGIFIERKPTVNVRSNNYPKHRIFYIDPKTPKSMRPIILNINENNIKHNPNMIKQNPNNLNFFNNAEWPPVSNANASRNYEKFYNSIARYAKTWRMSAALKTNIKRVNALKKTALPNNLANEVGKVLRTLTRRRLAGL